MDVLVIVKASYKAELRRLQYIKPADVRYNDLYSKLALLFNIPAFKLFYLDDDQDEITITDDSDVQEAIKYHLASAEARRVTVRLVLKRVNSPSLETIAPSAPIPFDNTEAIPHSATRSAYQNVPDESTAAQGEAEAEVVHYNVICDTCSYIIRGIRWKCKDCRNYDLCTACKNGSHTHNSAHRFRAIHTPTILSSIVQSIQAPHALTPAPPTTPPTILLPVTPPPTTPPPTTPPPTAPTSLVPATKQPDTSSELVIHEDIICDHCFLTIYGMRWKCQDCPDFDLCQSCKSDNRHNHHSSHNFSAIPYPGGVAQPEWRYLNRNYHSAQCDFCESFIKGIRNKCLQCPDFDLCDDCVPLAETQHPEHTFVQIVKPGCPDIKPASSIAHPGIYCDNCNKAVSGVRYKCVNCPNFDFCCNCEANPLTKHDPTHLFLKVKNPVVVSLGSQWPLLQNFYDHSGRRRTRATFIDPTPETKPSPVKPSRNNPPEEPLSIDRCPVEHNETIRLTQPSLVPASSASSPASSSSTNMSEAFFRNMSQLPVAPQTIANPVQSNPINTPVEVVAVKDVRLESPVTSPPVVADAAQPPLAASVRSPTPTPSTSQFLDARFVEDINIEDGSTMEPKARFLKMWKAFNNGTVTWPEGSELTFCGGDKCFNDSLTAGDHGPRFSVPAADPEREVLITADLQAPENPGRYVSYWRIVAPDGMIFGHRFWCDIVVSEADISSASSSMIFPTLNTQQEQEFRPASETSALSSPIFAPTTVQTSVEDPFRDPPSMAPSLASSAILSSGNSEAGDDDDATVVTASIRSSLPSGIQIPGNDDYSDYQDDTASSFSDISSRASFGDEEFVFVRDDFPTASPQMADDLEQSVHISRAPERPSRVVVEDEEDELEFGTPSERRPLMESTESIFGAGEYAVGLENQMKQLHDMGFADDEVNRYLLTAFGGDVEAVIVELLNREDA